MAAREAADIRVAVAAPGDCLLLVARAERGGTDMGVSLPAPAEMEVQECQSRVALGGQVAQENPAYQEPKEGREAWGRLPAMADKGA